MAIYSENARWYDPATGNAVPEIMGVNGKLRPPNKRDAAKLGLVKSVSSYLKTLDKPALNVWIRNQTVMACLTTSRLDGESDEAFIARIEADASEQAKKAAERGTNVHRAIQRHILGESYDQTYQPQVEAVRAELLKHGVDLMAGIPERSFVNVERGFAGCPDWRDATTVLDYKTRDTLETKQKAYPEQGLQLCGYALGLGIVNPRLGNVFIGMEPAACQVVWWEPEQVSAGTQAFESLVAMCKAMEKI